MFIGTSGKHQQTKELETGREKLTGTGQTLGLERRGVKKRGVGEEQSEWGRNRENRKVN